MRRCAVSNRRKTPPAHFPCHLGSSPETQAADFARRSPHANHRDGALRPRTLREVEFSAEDASRTEIDYLCEVALAAAEAGADVVNLPDTVGYSTPG